MTNPSAAVPRQTARAVLALAAVLAGVWVTTAAAEPAGGTVMDKTVWETFQRGGVVRGGSG